MSDPIVILPPPAPSPLPTPRDWPQAIEMTPPPTDTANTVVEYGPHPAEFMAATLLLTVLIGNLVLAGRNGRRK